VHWQKTARLWTRALPFVTFFKTTIQSIFSFDHVVLAKPPKMHVILKRVDPAALKERKDLFLNNDLAITRDQRFDLVLIRNSGYTPYYTWIYL